MKTIYKITNVINGKIYVGCCSDFSKRKHAHKRHAKEGTYKEGSRLYPDMLVYGLSNFIFQIIEIVDEESARDKEAYWISKLGSFTNGYNTTPHGLNGPGFWSGKKRPELSAQKKGKMVLIQDAIDASKKKVFCIETGEVFESLTQAGFKFNRTASAIWHAIKNDSKSAGLHWKYLN